MKVFISWSGERSRMVAAALNDWLPKVIQALRPFYSAEMEKGAQWSTQIDTALEGTSFGLACLTPENLDSRWIHFEAGALSKLPGSRLWTLLLDLRPGAVDHPLGKFQSTVADKADIRKLLDAINQQLPVPLTSSVLDDAFELRWPALEEKIAAALAIIPVDRPKATRDSAMILEEILSLIRAQERRFESEGKSLHSHQPRRYVVGLRGDAESVAELWQDVEDFPWFALQQPQELGPGFYHMVGEGEVTDSLKGAIDDAARKVGVSVDFVVPIRRE
ncbi:MAG TPA: TIR domain-containing protein [Longimicrobium sp.]|jgi:hypothetical protein